MSILNVCWKYKGKYSNIVRSRPTWRYAMQYGWVRYLYQSGTLYQSGNNYFDDDIITRLSNYYFYFKGDSYRFRKPNLFIFISARDFSFPHFAFTLLKNFKKFKTFLLREGIFHRVKGNIFSFLIPSNRRFDIWVSYFVASGKAKLPLQTTFSPLGNIVKGENYYQKR